MKILIIVESPAKAQTIQKILGNDEYIVKSSFRHIRNLCCKSYNNLGVDFSYLSTPQNDHPLAETMRFSIAFLFYNIDNSEEN